MIIDITREVIHGRKIGRALGFPTANMSLEGYELIPRGVYRSEVIIDGASYRGMSNVGIRPSVGGKELLLETHVIDFSGDLYGRTITVRLVERLRDERRFSSIGDLKEQLIRDYHTCCHTEG